MKKARVRGILKFNFQSELSQILKKILKLVFKKALFVSFLSKIEILKVWYRDSQLYETKQINEFTAEVANYTDEAATNFIKWTGDKEDQLEIEVTIKIPKRVSFSASFLVYFSI